jgi:phosphoheptose isomerase
MSADDAIRGAIESALRDGARLRLSLLDRTEDVLRAAKLVADALLGGHKVLVFGNGGSAADAQHIAAELVGRFVIERAPLPAIALTVDTSALTAIGNDYGFDEIFARQVRALGAPGDVAIAITTSGKSPNVLRAVEAAREKGMLVVGLTGKKGEGFAKICDACVAVPSTNTARIQELHITVGHLVCETVDRMIVSRDAADGPPKAAGANQEAARPRRHAKGKEVDLDTLLELRAEWKKEGRVVVWTNGVFDVLHAGHLASLRAARVHGDVLVVGINADETVRRAKGPSRPVFPAADRAALLAALEVVDHVVVFEEETPARVLEKLQPDVHCKGSDYAPPNGAPMPEAEVVRAYGGRIEFLPLVAQLSSTRVIERLSAK